MSREGDSGSRYLGLWPLCGSERSTNGPRLRGAIRWRLGTRGPLGRPWVRRCGRAAAWWTCGRSGLAPLAHPDRGLSSTLVLWFAREVLPTVPGLLTRALRDRTRSSARAWRGPRQRAYGDRPLRHCGEGDLGPSQSSRPASPVSWIGTRSSGRRCWQTLVWFGQSLCLVRRFVDELRYQCGDVQQFWAHTGKTRPDQVC